MARRALAPALLPVLTMLLAPAPLSAWGDTGHRMACALALRSLPPGPRAWYSAREAELQDHASDPDRWSATDRKEKRRHYIHAEAYGGPGGVPPDQGEALAKVGPEAFQKAGQLPWNIQDRWQDLVDAFRGGDPRQVALATAVLGHYVADLHVPLHTTQRHDGDGPGQRGLHQRWESSLVARYVKEEELQVHPASEPAAGLRAPWAWMAASHALVPKLLADDLEAGQSSLGGKRGAAYRQVFWSLEGDTVKRQLEQSGQHLGDLVLMAWQAAGHPEAPSPNASS